MREYNLKLDDVINDQRKVIYSLRNKILQKQDTVALLHNMVDETIELCYLRSLSRRHRLFRMEYFINRKFKFFFVDEFSVDTNNLED